ncbi:MAG TPA: hypothetical protein VIN09_02040 [Chloroflexota bacterium]
MPFIRSSDIEALRAPLDQLVEHLQSLPQERRAPTVSYIMLRLLVDTFGDDIGGLIEGVGTIEETKLTYYAELMEPIERRILLRRWVDREWPNERRSPRDGTATARVTPRASETTPDSNRRPVAPKRRRR